MSLESLATFRVICASPLDVENASLFSQKCLFNKRSYTY